MGNPGCPRCRGAVSLHDGRPFVTETGAVQLWHRACFDVRDQPLPSVEPRSAEPAPPPSAPVRRRFVKTVSVASIVTVGLVGWAAAKTPSTAVANIDMRSQEEATIRGAVTTHEIVPPRVVRGEEFAMPTINDVPLDRVYPSLRGWIHPVAASTERVPERGSRRFGSERVGIERPECGAGHCGVDLDGPRGRPILAVAAGTVVRVERSELGQDGRSGRYVRLEHDDGTLTAYMHLDDVADVRVGDRIDAGQYLGTLGATAVYNAPPHLHFSLEIPDRPGVRGDHTETEYVDPAPMLQRARILPMPAREPKPAF